MQCLNGLIEFTKSSGSQKNVLWLYNPTVIEKMLDKHCLPSSYTYNRYRFNKRPEENARVLALSG